MTPPIHQPTLPADFAADIEPPILHVDKLRQEQARAFVRRLLDGEEQGERLEWFDDVDNLTQMGFTLDEACYVAWACMPAGKRVPATKGELANLLGYKTNTALNKWANRPDIVAAVASMSRQRVLAGMPEVLAAAMAVAKQEDYKGHNDRKMLLMMAGMYSEQSSIQIGQMQSEEQVRQLSDEELERRLAAVRPAISTPVEADDSDPTA